MSDYLFDGNDHEGESADPEVEALEQLLGGFAHDRALRLGSATLRTSTDRKDCKDSRDRRGAWMVAALAIAASVAIALLWPEPPPSPEIARSSRPLDDSTGLSCMEAEETGVGPLGPFMDPDTEGCVMEPPQGCRLARVDAAPGWAEVDANVDLDCAYTLTLDDASGTHLRVTRGVVILDDEGTIVWVPAGNELWSRPGRAPGLPLVISASAPLRAAAARFEEGDPLALAQLLALLGKDDLGTAWNLLVRSAGDQRNQVLARIDALHSPDSAIRQAARLGLEAPRLDPLASAP